MPVKLLDDMGCQAGVEAANLTTFMTDDKTKTSKSYDTIKLGIDAHAKCYYLARQLDGADHEVVGAPVLHQLVAVGGDRPVREWNQMVPSLRCFPETLPGYPPTSSNPAAGALARSPSRS